MPCLAETIAVTIVERAITKWEAIQKKKHEPYHIQNMKQRD